MFLFLERVPAGSWSSGSCFKMSNWVSFTFGLGAFQTAAFGLGLRASESACKPFKSGFSIPYISVVLQDLIPVYIKFEGLISLVHDPRVEVLDVGHKPPCSSGKSSIFLKSLLIVGHCAWGGVLAKACLCLSYLSQIRPFIFCCEGTVHLVSRTFSEEIIAC